ncbi:hypothetical protein ARMGADRAFT_1082129 [Armillaria gallica]|uniref:Uncharacterized protein n=1 Tax=Armillaria gallica TaxID=47427 RepID=A0A2H3D6J7_ARMGA|nr:hypothetical protein ARMGADRAFT_1082129 [Armillaria gallica]
MNVFTIGSRVFFYDSAGRLTGGVVESTSRMSDASIGTLMIAIKRDSGGIVTLPAAGVSNALLPVMAGGQVGKRMERNDLGKNASYVTDTDAISQSFSSSSALLILHSPKHSEE